jgi:ribonuclease HII
MPLTVPILPVVVSMTFTAPAFSVTNSTGVPGAKAIAQGSSKVATSLVNGGRAAWLLRRRFPRFRHCAQLASSQAARDKAASKRDERIMLGVTPGFTVQPAASSSASTRQGAGRWPGRWWPRRWFWGARYLRGSTIPSAFPPSAARCSTKRSADLRLGGGGGRAEEIDRLNIFMATMEAMTRAVGALTGARGAGCEVLIDGNMTPQGRCAGWCWPARAIVGGDGIEPCISAASIIAKEWRDRLMLEAAGAPALRVGAQQGLWHRRAHGSAAPATAPPRCTAAALHRCRSCR